MEKISLDLTQIDGNAFSIMGAFSKQAKKEGWSKESIKSVMDEAQSDDYDHLLRTIISYIK